MRRRYAACGGREGSAGVGEVNASVEPGDVDTPPNPNKALDAFVKPVADGTVPAFDAVSWTDVAEGERLLGLGLVGDVSWADASWNAVSWATSPGRTCPGRRLLGGRLVGGRLLDGLLRTRMRAEGDAAGDATDYKLTPEQAAQIMADPDAAPDPENLPAGVAG